MHTQNEGHFYISLTLQTDRPKKKMKRKKGEGNVRSKLEKASTLWKSIWGVRDVWTKRTSKPCGNGKLQKKIFWDFPIKIERMSGRLQLKGKNQS